MDRFKKFQYSYELAISRIKKFQNPNDSEIESMHKLVKWMMETNVHPYHYLTETWVNTFHSAERFAELIEQIYHAVYDDGEMTFVTVNDQPRIVFACSTDTNFREKVLTFDEINLEKHGYRFGQKVEHDIQVLNIKPNEFGEIYDRYKLDYELKMKELQQRITAISGAIPHLNLLDESLYEIKG